MVFLSQQLLQHKYSLNLLHQLLNVSKKNDGTTIDVAEDLDLVMPMSNLIEYTSNSSKTKGSLSFYSKDEATNFTNNIENNDNFKSFNYKAKLLRITVGQPLKVMLINF